VTSILRNLPQLHEFVVAWDFPLMRVAGDLNPDALRRPQSKNKVCSDKEFLDAVMTDDGKSFTKIMQEAKSALNLSQSTAQRALKRLETAGLVRNSGGLYWRTVTTVTSLKE
jgi:DNA-binding transcriptional ArsR family regulator